MSQDITPHTAPNWVLIEGSACIALNREGISPQLSSPDPQVIAELQALTGGREAIIEVDNLDSGAIDAAIDKLIEHIRHHVRYEVAVEYLDIDHREATRPVLSIKAAHRGRGVGDLLTDVAGYLVAKPLAVSSTAANTSTPAWLTVTSLSPSIDNPSPHVEFHSVTYVVDTDPDNNEHAQGILTLNQHQVAELAATAITTSKHPPSAQTPNFNSTPDELDTSGNDSSEGTPSLKDIDVLLGGILRSVVAQIENNQLDEDEVNDPTVHDDREAVINTLVMAATMLEDHTVHDNPEITRLVITNLRQLAQRSEANLPEHIRANPTAALEQLARGNNDVSASTTNPVQLSLAIAAELSADRIAEF